MSEGTREQLEAMLEAAGLPATAADIEAQFSSTFPVMRAAVELLHAVPGACEEVPADHFDPDPSFDSWHDSKEPT
jgi:hypothetical protein